MDASFVIGSFSGVGKSTFINCFRNVQAEDEGAARVGVVETTNEPKAYEHPDFANLKVWDLPGRDIPLFETTCRRIILGVGTPNYPRSEYLQKIQFERYDFFLILCRTRFTGTCSSHHFPHLLYLLF